MKKVFIGVLAALMLFAFTACESQGYKIPTGLTVTATKTSYLAGADLDMSTISGVLEYSDGSTRTISGSELNGNRTASASVIFTYGTASGGLSATVDFTIYQPSEITKLTVSELPETAKSGDTEFENVPAVATLPDGTTADVKTTITVTAISGSVGTSVAVTPSKVEVDGTDLFAKTEGLDNWKVTVVNSSDFNDKTIASLAIEYVNTTTPTAVAGTYYVDDVVTYKVYAVDGSGNRKELTSGEYGVMGGKTLPASFTVKEAAGTDEYKLYLASDPTKVTSTALKAPQGTACVESVTFEKIAEKELAAAGGTLEVSQLSTYYTVKAVKHGDSASFTPSADNTVITNGTWAANEATTDTVFAPSIMVKVGKGAGAWVAATANQLTVAGK